MLDVDINIRHRRRCRYRCKR